MNDYIQYLITIFAQKFILCQEISVISSDRGKKEKATILPLDFDIVAILQGRPHCFENLSSRISLQDNISEIILPLYIISWH